MGALSPFLVGGPAFSGTTLLSVLLDGDGVVCLDEPDFAKPDQVHRNIPLLRERFPELALPDPPGRPLTPTEELALIQQCAEVLAPALFGIKTCGPTFVELARHFRAAGLRVAAIFRDPRDVLVRDQRPPGMTEAGLLGNISTVWAARDDLDGWVRYEDLVGDPSATLARVVGVLGLEAVPVLTWDPDALPDAVFKTDRHEALRGGAITADRIGLWRSAPTALPPEAHRLAEEMGYPV